MPDREKVKQGIYACILQTGLCSDCPYKGDSSRLCAPNLYADVMELQKKQQEVIDALLKVGYPHNFQNEKPWIRDYMYEITEVVKKAFEVKSDA